MFQLLYSQGNSHQHPLNRKLDGAEAVENKKKKNLLPLPGIKPQLLGNPAHSYHYND
jgi:hypothetical protein